MHYEFQLNLYSNPTSALKSKLQLYLVHKFKLIKQSLEDLTLFIESLLNLIQEKSNLDLEFTEFNSSQVKNELLISFYSTCLTEIYTSVNKLDISSNHYIASQLVKLINSTNYYDSFSITYDFCTAKSNEIYFYLMKNFISNHSIKNLLIERFESRNKNSNFLEETCIQKLCNLPDKFLSIIEPKISFKNKKVYSSYFLPNNYYLILTTDLYMCLKTLNEKLLNNLEGIQFLSTVYGKISFNGYSEILFDKLIKNLLILCYNNEIWKAFSRKFFEFMPYKYLEASLLSLIRKLSSYEDLEILLQDLGTSNSNFKHLLCDKFLFFKIVKEDKFIQILLGYLFKIEKFHQNYYELFKRLLNSWSNQASIANTSYEQHLYLSKCIIIGFSYLDDQGKATLSQDITKPLLNGVEKHLHSPFDNIRLLGMIIGEIIMNDLFKEIEKDDPKKSLTFDYEKTSEINELIALKNKPCLESIFKKGHCKIEEPDLGTLIEQNLKFESDEKDKIIFENKNLGINISQSVCIDSDDEDKLEAYDLSNDTKNVKVKKPVYLRDCLNSLIYSDDPQEIETALKSVKSLCDTYHTELEEISVELLRVLLSKSNSYSIKDFDEDRMSAMITVTCHYPKDCAIYLTSQFYEAGFSLSQRGDILNVLTMTAQKLSDPNVENIIDKRALNKNYVNFNQLYENSFQNILKKKTVTAAEIKKKKVVKTKENKFSDSIGYFFFPLLNSYDKGRVYFSLMEKDFSLLGKMIFSLAVILHLSENTQVQENMIKALSDFLWSVKNHSEDFVRKSVIFAYTIIVMVVPDNLLFGYLNNYFIELKYWLEGVILSDAKTECKKEAQVCLSLMSNRVKSGFKIFT